jgi:cyclic-di-GMP phosphodiesterase TipF (flagellum assembly factor)
MRLRDRTDVGGQIADCRAAPPTSPARSPNSGAARRRRGPGGVGQFAGADRIQAVIGEINELGVLVKQLAIVRQPDDMLAVGRAAAPLQPRAAERRSPDRTAMSPRGGRAGPRRAAAAPLPPPLSNYRVAQPRAILSA